MEISNQLLAGVLAALGALIIRRFRISKRIPKRIVPLVPMVLSMVIWGWVFVRDPGQFASIWEMLETGIISGLLGSGMLHILLGVTSE
jgi:hypothetical protein